MKITRMVITVTTLVLGGSLAAAPGAAFGSVSSKGPERASLGELQPEPPLAETFSPTPDGENTASDIEPVTEPSPAPDANPNLPEPNPVPDPDPVPEAGPEVVPPPDARPAPEAPPTPERKSTEAWLAHSDAGGAADTPDSSRIDLSSLRQVHARLVAAKAAVARGERALRTHAQRLEETQAAVELIEQQLAAKTSATHQLGRIQSASPRSKMEIRLVAMLNPDLLGSLGSVERFADLSNASSAPPAHQPSGSTDVLEDRLRAARVTEKELLAARPDAELAAARTDLEAAQAELQILAAASGVDPASLLSDDALTTRPLTPAEWVLPVRGTVSDRFGPRPNKPLPDVADFHSGTDLAAACGTPVFAAADGVVTVVNPGQAGLGHWIEIQHESGIITGYAHLLEGSFQVQPNDRVKAGDLIAAVGNTGASTGCHLHLVVEDNGAPIDPVAFLARQGVRLGS